jgi:hypothetical protein
VALSVVAVASIVRSADVTVPHYAARDTLTPGTILGEGDVVITRVRVDAAGYLDADAADPFGQVVTRVIGAGELIPAGALTEVDNFDARPVAVRTTLPLAESIGRGALVDVWLTVEGEDGPESRLVAGGLVVDQVDRATGALSVGNAETVYVVVPVPQMPEFLDAIAADGDISVVGLAGSGA